MVSVNHGIRGMSSTDQENNILALGMYICMLIHFSGKRKGRGGRRGLPAAGDLPSDSPKRKDSRIEFQGHLSHASPPITSFFQPQSKEQSCSNSENAKIADQVISISINHIDNDTSEERHPEQAEISTCETETSEVLSQSTFSTSLVWLM